MLSRENKSLEHKIEAFDGLKRNSETMRETKPEFSQRYLLLAEGEEALHFCLATLSKKFPFSTGAFKPMLESRRITPTPFLRF